MRDLHCLAILRRMATTHGAAVGLVVALTWSVLLGSLPARAAEVPFSAQQVISTAADGAFSVHAGDVDGDGDLDLMSASQLDNAIAWYENDGAANPSFTRIVISRAADSAQSVHAGDVDGDGDLDLISASFHDDAIAWYENDGAADPSFTRIVISTAADGAFSVHAGDVDGDGDLDLLSASVNDDAIAWYENDGAADPSFTQIVISTAADGAQSVHVGDVDGDGDLDLISASFNDDAIAWYENVPVVLFSDGFETGGTGAWSGVVP